MNDWPSFAEHLTAELGELPLGARVIVFEPEPARVRRFVQFARDAEVLSVQLIGDKYLDPDRRPGPAGYQALTEGGWHHPDVDNGHLWWVDFPAPITGANCRRAAELTVVGLRDGYGITNPTELAYDAWLETPTRLPLTLPALALPRQPMP
ncbi:hypothetical protein AB0I35_09285 [Nocardia sp. NPDC050378]|uniref:TY-Chap domain-containing protein n=1 Tax=Nocardia sp. NPDC050378 TaxID=3155400 RepID=UPI0033E6E144